MKRLYSVLALSVVVSASAMAQVSFYNNGAVTVQSGGSIYVGPTLGGKMQIDASGSLANDGSVEITGDFENDRTDGAVTSPGSSGVMKFTNNGNSQSLTAPNSSTGLSFYNLESDNSVAIIAGVGTGLVSNTDIKVNGNLIFNGNGSGYGGIVMNTHNLLLSSTSTISGGGSSNYAYFTNNGTTSGTFGQLITSTGNIGLTPLFPYYMGTSSGSAVGGYVPAQFRLNSIPSQANKIAISFYPQANLGTIFYVGQCNLPGYNGNNFMINQMVSNFGYWQVDVSDSSNTNIDNVTGWNYEAIMHPTTTALSYMNSNYGSSYYKLVKIQSHDSGGNLLAAPTSSTDWSSALLNSGIICNGIALINSSPNISTASSTGITATDLTSFSRFGGGGDDGGSGLPITLVSVDAAPIDNQFIRVSWETAIEINNSGFDVQKSTDGVNFANIGWVAGNGNSTEPIQYLLDDKEVVPNTVYYYRLNQVDMNGASHLSNIVTAALSLDNVFTVSEFIPNPTVNSSRIEVISSSAKKINITLYNTLGEMIDQRTELSVTSGKTPVDFDLSQVAAGTYYAVIVADSKMYNKKLIVNK